MIEDIARNFSVGGGIVWSIVALILFYVGYDLYTDYKVSRLGAFAPRIKTYLPLSRSSPLFSEGKCNILTCFM